MPAVRARRVLLGVAIAAILAPCGSVFSADVDDVLLREAEAGGAADVLISFPGRSIPVLAPLAPDADYKVRRRALVDALTARADTEQAGVRARSEEHTSELQSRDNLVC